MPDYISAMDTDEIVEYILYFDIGTECDNFENNVGELKGGCIK